MRKRIIPVLLIHNRGLVKSNRFSKFQYIGDPINAVRIFNDKAVDELVVLDIDATKENRGPDFDLVSNIVSEAFMPVSYGGGISNPEQVQTLLKNGIEKVILNHAAFAKPQLITSLANAVGRQSVVVSVDIKYNVFGKPGVYILNGKKKVSNDPVKYVKQCVESGAGEIILQSIDRDGTYQGYDLDLVRKISKEIDTPLVALGGAGKTEDFTQAIKAGASAVAAGSFFLFQRPHQAVLISYPNEQEINQILINSQTQ